MHLDLRTNLTEAAGVASWSIRRTYCSSMRNHVHMKRKAQFWRNFCLKSVHVPLGTDAIWPGGSYPPQSLRYTPTMQIDGKHLAVE